METKPLLHGLIGFFIGGALVAIAATTFDKPNDSSMTMDSMTKSLEEMRGDDYDAAFISYMIEHHQSAVDMALLSDERAKHDEIKTLSKNIFSAQETEIADMRDWQKRWNYSDLDHSNMNH